MSVNRFQIIVAGVSVAVSDSLCLFPPSKKNNKSQYPWSFITACLALPLKVQVWALCFVSSRVSFFYFVHFCIAWSAGHALLYINPRLHKDTGVCVCGCYAWCMMTVMWHTFRFLLLSMFAQCNLVSCNFLHATVDLCTSTNCCKMWQSSLHKTVIRSWMSRAAVQSTSTKEPDPDVTSHLEGMNENNCHWGILEKHKHWGNFESIIAASLQCRILLFSTPPLSQNDAYARMSSVSAVYLHICIYFFVNIYIYK